MNPKVLNEHETKLNFALDCTEGLSWEITLDFKKIIFDNHFEKMLGLKQTDFNYKFGNFVDLHIKPYKDQIFESLRKYVLDEADMVSVDITKQKNMERQLIQMAYAGANAYTPQYGLSAEFIKKHGLSKRQAEITEALLRGKSNREIAYSMNIEINTVQVHLQSVYRKTGAPGRYALMALVGLNASGK
jgi:DNA-binding CsgD family transcriptional regulator